MTKFLGQMCTDNEIVYVTIKTNLGNGTSSNFQCSPVPKVQY